MNTIDSNSNPVRILDLRDSPWVDGPGRTVLQTAESIGRDSHCIIVGGFCSGDVESNVYLKEAKSRSLTIQPIFESHPFDLRIFRQIEAAVENHRIDLIHTHDLRSNIAGLVCAKRSGLPIVATCHGWIANDTKGRVKNLLDTKLLKIFDRIVAVSDRMRDQLVGKGVDADKVETIANALVLKDYQPDSGDSRFRDELKLQADSRLVLCVGRLSAEKGQSVLLDAFKSAHTLCPNLHLVFVGIGPEEHSLMEKVKQLGLEKSVLFGGFRSDMECVYNSADLVVQSSFTEGMPNVILESLLMETPVVATNVGGTAEVVEHGSTGYLVQPNSVESLVGGIQDFLENEPAHKKMASNGRKKIVEQFDHDSRVRKIANLYSSVVQTKGR